MLCIPNVDESSPHWCPKLDAVLEYSHKVSATRLDHVQIVRFLLILHPLVRLTLGVNHQRPAAGVTAQGRHKVNAQYWSGIESEQHFEISR